MDDNMMQMMLMQSMLNSGNRNSYGSYNGGKGGGKPRNSNFATGGNNQRACNYFLAGAVCPFGDNCKFLHESDSKNAVKPKTSKSTSDNNNDRRPHRRCTLSLHNKGSRRDWIFSVPARRIHCREGYSHSCRTPACCSSGP